VNFVVENAGIVRPQEAALLARRPRHSPAPLAAGINDFLRPGIEQLTSATYRGAPSIVGC
jgi:hypothetical protein